MANAYLAKQKMMINKSVSIGEDIGMNRTLDMMMLVLTDPKYMGKDTIGKTRFLRIWDGMKEMDRKYGNAFTQEIDADVCQEKIDERWKLLLGDNAQTFYQRYPYLKNFDYTKKNKSWR